jgi:hypothetical protein
MALTGPDRSLVGRAVLEVGGTEVAGVHERLTLSAEAGAERCPAGAAADGRRHRASVRAAPVDSPFPPEFPTPEEATRTDASCTYCWRRVPHGQAPHPYGDCR